MGVTDIEWSHYTFNPWIGCWEVSPGCQHCYAREIAARFAGGYKDWSRVGPDGDLWGRPAARLFAPEKYWQQLARWNRAAIRAGERRRVFCASMADIFEPHPVEAVRRAQDAARARLLEAVEECTALDFLLLSKRVEHAGDLVPRSWLGGSWPGNGWLLFTAEDQRRLDERAPFALELPAPVHGVSHEPALGPLDLSGLIERTKVERSAGALKRGRYISDGAKERRISWIISGAESGHGARPMETAWIEKVQRQCQAAGVAFFYKQAPDPKRRGKVISLPVLGGRQWAEFPVVAAP